MEDVKMTFKRFHESTVIKDYLVAFAAGLFSGFIVLIYGNVFPALKEGNYKAAGIWFAGFIILIIILFPLGYWGLCRIFVKK